MPIPKPHKDETKDEFVSRCMSELNSEYPDEEKRVGICYSSWDNAKFSESMDKVRKQKKNG